jgi:FkbM family methyltransferase
MKQLLKTPKISILRLLNCLGYSLVKLPPRPGQTTAVASVLLGGRPIKIHKGNPLYHAYRTDPQWNSRLGIVAAIVKERFPAAWAVDVGANVGDTLAIIKGKAAMPVICVEGDPICYELLQENARQFENVSLVKTFLSDKPYETKVILQKTGWNTTLTEAGKDAGAQIVRFQTLDQAVQELNKDARVKLVKVDTEGYDLRVLRGAAGILERERPVITFELNRESIEPLGDSVGDFFDYLVALGYHHFILNDSGGRFVCALNEQSKGIFLDLYRFSCLGRPIYYYDIWVFHRSDKELFESFLAQERARD